MTTPAKVQLKKTGGKLEIQAPGEVRSLGHIRKAVADLAHTIGFPEDEVAKVEMAVDEACSNVVKHAYAPDKQWCWRHDPEIRLEIRTEDGRLVIEINDHGQKFDFAGYQPASIQARINDMKTSGYGIFIMRQFMDEVQYHSSDQEGNTLRLVKYLKKP